jgi:vancomycin resistance protein YoaR
MDMLMLIGDQALTQAVMSGKPLPPEADAIISQAAATVAEKLNKIDEAKARIMAGEETDPLVRMQEMELMLRKMELDMKAMKDAAQLKLEYDKLHLQESKLMIDDVNTDLDREAKIKMSKEKKTK